MALVVNDRVKETTAVVGTGTATLLGAALGFQSFAVIGNGNTTYYCISDQGGANWEVGIGTYTASGTTLARTTVLASSNGGALVVFTTGTKDVFCTYPAEKSVHLDASGNAIGLGTPASFVGTNITGTATGLTAGNATLASTVTTNANLTGAVTSTGNATSLGSFTSANLAGALTDETGSGSAVFATSPTLVTPNIGVATGTSLVTTGTTTTGQFSSGSTFAYKNRIINGGMVIDQRNAGASVSINGTSSYVTDRFKITSSGGGIISASRSTTAPTGFVNSLSSTVSTADSSIASSDLYVIDQIIEGFNTADLGFGTASASTVTLSFWVRSSVTGTYGVRICNGSFNRTYVSTYAINSANTWEQKSITIAGDTTGTWTTDNSSGIAVSWDLGSGTNWNGTGNAWQAGNVLRTSGCVNWIANASATFYITGVQLEKGSVATSFDQRAYSQELAMCQRYYQGDILTAVGGGATPLAINRLFYCAVNFPVPFRATPTMTIINTITSINMNAGEWTQLDALRGYFQATNSVTNDCVLTAKSSGAAEL